MDNIPYETYERQLELIQQKNINIQKVDKETGINILKNHSYYSLINGYKPYFLRDNESDYMRDGTTFNHFYAVKILEMDLSSILFKYLQIIEQGFRTRVAHIIAREFATDDQKYLLKENYINNKARWNTLKELRKLRDDPNKNSYSNYFKEDKKVSIPPWILLQDANFYTVINLYTCLPNNLRQEIREEYINLSKIKAENLFFSDSMHLIREYRNIYAHSKRNFDEKINYSLDYSLTQTCKIPALFKRTSFDNNLKGKGLNVVIPLIFNYLTDDFLYIRLRNDLDKLFIDDGYVDENLNGIKLFNDLTIYGVLELPEDFLTLIRENSPIPSG